MTESAKLRRLQILRSQLMDDSLSEQDRKTGVITDTDGRQVRMSDPDALTAIDRRIAAEENPAP